MSEPHKCPACDGRGKRETYWGTTAPTWETCHACSGTGIVWGPPPFIIDTAKGSQSASPPGAAGTEEA